MEGRIQVLVTQRCKRVLSQISLEESVQILYRQRRGNGGQQRVESRVKKMNLTSKCLKNNSMMKKHKITAAMIVMKGLNDQL